MLHSSEGKTNILPIFFQISIEEKHLDFPVVEGILSEHQYAYFFKLWATGSVIGVQHLTMLRHQTNKSLTTWTFTKLNRTHSIIYTYVNYKQMQWI